MKRALTYAALSAFLLSAPVMAHHAAEGILDDELYAMIDEMVADTTHAEIDLTDLGGGDTEIVVSTPSVRALENMIDDGLLDYASMLDGDVTMTIEFDDRGGATAVILQDE